ncbi:hypothetical protein F4703DRAFT_1842711 [Phycomyces blakesleeanus]
MCFVTKEQNKSSVLCRECRHKGDHIYMYIYIYIYIYICLERMNIFAVVDTVKILNQSKGPNRYLTCNLLLLIIVKISHFYKPISMRSVTCFVF